MSVKATETANIHPRYDIPRRESHHSDAYFPEEEKDWHGYIEWGKYPDKKAEAAKILVGYIFAGVSRGLYRTSPCSYFMGAATRSPSTVFTCCKSEV